MEKTATLNLRVNPEDKKSAENVLSQLGIPMATAVGMFLKQIILTNSIPFNVALPKAPDSVNTDKMSVSQVRNLLDEGINDIKEGHVRPAREVFLNIYRPG